ncbi:MAG: nucleotide exchange factor GrpE [Treponema sp.]|nr:nucleotide exchange factor GrpE [Treponema sp.]
MKNARDPDTAPEQAEQSPETAGGQPSEKAADAETTAENEGAPQAEKEAGETRPSSAEDRIAGLEAKLAEANDQYLRKAADFENYRKRMNQEKQSAIDYANQTLFLDLILVIDDFERAIKSAESQREAAGGDGEQIAAGYNSLYEGITMIEKNLVSQMENKWGLKRFDSAGEPFDPNRHEAIMMEKSAGIDEPVVAEDFIKGYILKDRVIRPAKVKVVMPESK